MKRPLPWLLLALLVVLCLCLICLLALVAFLRPDWLPFELPSLSRQQILLRVPDRRQGSDYYLLRPGQEIPRARLLADDALEPSPTLWGQQTEQGFTLRPFGFGAFLPEGRGLLYSVQTEDGTSLNLLRRLGGEPTEIHDTNARIMTILTGQTDEAIFVIEEPEAGRVRCYVSLQGEVAQRVARGDTCQVSQDGSTLFVSDTSAGALTLTAYNLDGTDPMVLLDGEPGTDGSFRFSADGTRVAYVATDGNLSHVVVQSREDGSVVAEGEDAFTILSYEFSRQGSALAIVGETEAGDLALTLLQQQSIPIASGSALEAAFSPDGQSLIYLVGGEGGDEALFVHLLEGGEDVAVLDGGNLSFALLQDPDTLLITQDLEGETILYRAGPRGSDLEELFSVDGLRGLQVFDLPDDPRFFALSSDREGRQTLYVGPTGEVSGFKLLDDWSSLTPLDLSPDGRWFAFVGQEDPGDDPVLYAIHLVDLSSPIPLDNDLVAVQSALFTADGNDLFYTVLTGPDPDDVEVRSVYRGGDRPYEVLYPEAALEAASWGAPDPFASSALSFRTGLTTTSLCPGAQAIAPEQVIEDELAAGGRNCYRFLASDGVDYSVGVMTTDADLDSRMEVYDRQGNLIASDDDSGPGLSPRLRLTTEEGGLYYIYVFGFSESDAGAYTLTVTEGLPATLQTAAVLLPFDETLDGAITADSEVYIQEFDTSVFTAAYYFNAQPEDWIVVDLAAGSVGSSLEPMMALLDSNLQPLTFAESGADGDLHLVYSIPTSGRFYLLVLNSDEGYGPAEEFFFEITLTLGTPPEPGGGPIEIGDTVEGDLQATIHDEWTFTADAGDYVTISMTSNAFDTYLELYDPFGVSIAYDDDSGGNLNSLIRNLQLSTAGTYTIRARSYNGQSSGPYTLALTAGEPDTSTGGSIEVGEVVEGDLQRGDRDEWTFSGRAGQVVTITMTSDAIDSYLELRAPDGTTLTTNDDGAGYPNAMIDQYVLPQAGTYTIIARSYGDAGSGPYRLSLDEILR